MPKGLLTLRSTSLRSSKNEASGSDVTGGWLGYLTPDEEARLLQVCPERYKPFVTVALHAGLRKGELLGLR